MLKIKLSKCEKEYHLFSPFFKQMKVCFSWWNKWRFEAMWKQAELIYCQMLLSGHEAFHHWPQKNDLTKALSEKTYQPLLTHWQALAPALILSGLIILNYFNDYFSSKITSDPSSLPFPWPKTILFSSSPSVIKLLQLMIYENHADLGPDNNIIRHNYSKLLTLPRDQ